jgi:hypothetical protein
VKTAASPNQSHAYEFVGEAGCPASVCNSEMTTAPIVARQLESKAENAKEPPPHAFPLLFFGFFFSRFGAFLFPMAQCCHIPRGTAIPHLI